MAQAQYYLYMSKIQNGVLYRLNQMFYKHKKTEMNADYETKMLTTKNSEKQTKILLFMM